MTRAEILAEAERRMERGRHKYGEFDPATDPRDMLRELEEELLDAINYCTFMVQKIRQITDVQGVSATVDRGRVVVTMPVVPAKGEGAL